jgi:hypothetical protein
MMIDPGYKLLKNDRQTDHDRQTADETTQIPHTYFDYFFKALPHSYVRREEPDVCPDPCFLNFFVQFWASTPNFILCLTTGIFFFNQFETNISATLSAGD